jgi:hypothetical protein
MRDIVRVDGSPGTVLALLRRDVRSHHTVACPLRMSSRSAAYYHRPTTSMSCTHLMCCLHRVSGEAMMSLMSGVLGMHGHARGPRAIGRVAALEPSRTRRWVWSHMTRGDTGALPGSGPRASVMW